MIQTSTDNSSKGAATHRNPTITLEFK